jgi:hypothetical protein
MKKSDVSVRIDLGCVEAFGDVGELRRRIR